MVNRLFNTDVTVSGLVTATSGAFVQSLTISGVPVSTGTLSSINNQFGPNVSIVGSGGTTVASSSNTITISSSATATTNALIGGGSISVISGSNFTEIIDNALVGDGGLISVISGTNTQEIAAKAFVGTGGITVISGANQVTISGFHDEFVAASGSLQTQIATITGSENNASLAFTNQTLVTLTHNFGTTIYITTVYDTGGFIVEGALQQLVNQAIVSFNHGQSGTVVAIR